MEKTNNRQRYQCKNCGYRFTAEKRSTKKKRLALQLYLKGLGFRAISRVLDVNFITISIG